MYASFFDLHEEGLFKHGLNEAVCIYFHSSYNLQKKSKKVIIFYQIMP